MTATDELRRMLDERGVEWEDCGNGATYVEHNGEAWRFDYDEPFDQLCIVCLSGYTPAQAIAATLGATDANPTQAESSGTCHITDNGPWGYPYVCSACGASFDPDVNNGEVNFCPNCGRRIVGPTTNDVDGGGGRMSDAEKLMWLIAIIACPFAVLLMPSEEVDG